MLKSTLVVCKLYYSLALSIKSTETIGQNSPILRGAKVIVTHQLSCVELSTRYCICKKRIDAIDLVARCFELVTQLLALAFKHQSLHMYVMCMYV
jgi:hypothetical protein